ncbi:hypothetical protein EVB55_097 [Rhizobium phage RHph_Y68]|uniref:Uncharacterized protein n=1 Tax=Rhizobium phage RHph_Y68 TaxID=2509787 RepID=A0A7S5QY67_9CAUD|nr:hypothetical protein PP934_gp097 [Rhizobium phage RHph_Y68]QIG68032.1 hypothetical protein EVB55_097 [Rhizobium phage RHph_Y68]
MKMVETVKEAIEELRVNGNCRFHKGYITASEWKNSYLPELRKEFPDMWFTVNSNNHICVSAK